MKDLTYEEEYLLAYVRDHAYELRKALVLMILKNRDDIPTDPIYNLYLLLEELKN